jgi:hypothetical protein
MVDMGTAITDFAGSGLKMAAVTSGYMDDLHRKEAQKKEKPRVDLFEMEARLGAQIYDFTWLEQRASEEPVTAHLLRFLDMGVVLSLRLLTEIDKYDVIYTAGEDMAINLALLFRLAGRATPSIINRMEQAHYGSTPLRRSVYLATLRTALPRIDLTLCRTHAHVQTLVDDLGQPHPRVTQVSEPSRSGFLFTRCTDFRKQSVGRPGWSLHSNCRP